MSNGIAISVRQINKIYRIWENPAARLTSPMFEWASRLASQNSSTNRWLSERATKNYRDFWALRDVSLEVKTGESIGIIGRNGSGKSTLLQIIAGTLQPTSGSAQSFGRVAALLELGSGFNPDFTGRENVYLNAAILGLTKEQTDARFEQITNFAEIGSFIDQPVKTYSSGMMMRLAFAVQTAVDPNILIVDEALSVGDFFFQQKCFQRIKDLRTKGTTILFVSHDLGSVRDLCTRTLYLKGGNVVFCGDTQHAISRYYREDENHGDSRPASTPEAKPQETPVSITQSQDLDRVIAESLWKNADITAVSDQPARLLSVAVLDAAGSATNKFRIGDKALFRTYFRTETQANVHGAVELKNRHGQVISSLGSRIKQIAPAVGKANQTWCFDVEVTLGLEAGEYSFQIGLGLPLNMPNVGIRFAETPWLGPITVMWDYAAEPAPFLGMFDLPSSVGIRRIE